MDLFEQDGAHLTIRSNNPDLMDGEDPEIVGLVHKAYLKRYEDYSRLIGQNKMNWLVIAAPGLPGRNASFRTSSLWRLRKNSGRPFSRSPASTSPIRLPPGKSTSRNCRTRSNYLNAKQYTALHYTAPGTDLTVGLPAGSFLEQCRQHSPERHFLYCQYAHRRNLYPAPQRPDQWLRQRFHASEL